MSKIRTRVEKLQEYLDSESDQYGKVTTVWANYNRLIDMFNDVIEQVEEEQLKKVVTHIKDRSVLGTSVLVIQSPSTGIRLIKNK